MEVKKIVLYSDIIGTSDSEATTFTALTGSPYSPLKSGRLVGVKLLFSQTAATSVFSAGIVRLRCPTFGGVDVHVPFQGAGIHTAPMGVATGMASIQCDVPVQTGVDITAEWRCEAGITNVTVNITAIGIFEG